MVRRITLEINLNGGNRTAGEIRNITERFEELQAQMRSLEGVSQQLGTGVDQTDQLLSSLGLSAEQASQAINGILLEQQGIREAGSTVADLGITQTQADVLAGVLGNPDDIQQYIDLLNGLDSSLEAISEIARITGTSLSEAEDFVENLGVSADTAAEALRRIRAGQRVGADEATQRQNLGDLGLDETQLNSLFDAAGNGLGRTESGVGSLISRVGELSFAFNNVLFAIQTLSSQGQKAFDEFILSNERLRNEILSTQASIASTTDVLVNGVTVQDPSEAIDALEKPISESIKRIRKETLDLVGVTSSEVLGVFNILATSTGELANQSAEFPDGLRAAETLTKSFAAALGNLGIPLNQAKQEVNSILQGQVDQNSALALRLKIRNEDIRQLKAEGRLVDGLNEKLEAFVIANANQSRSISGFTSNLQDTREILFRESGEEIYADIVDQLERLYNFVIANEEAIRSGVTSAVDFIRELLKTVLEGIEGIAIRLTPLAKDLGSTLQEIAETGAESLIVAVNILFESVNQILSILEPVLNLLGQILKVLNDFGITEIAVQTGAVIAVITALDIVLAAMATTLFTSVVPAAIAAVTAIAPLLPLLLAVGTAVVALNAIKIGAGNDAIDAYSSSVKIAGDESFNYATKLKALNDIEKENGALTAEQQKQKEGLVNISRQLIEQNEKQIEEIKKLELANKSQQNSQLALIQQLEISNKTLKNQAGLLGDVTDEIIIQNRALIDRGSAYDQIRGRIENVLETVKRGTGDVGEVSKQAQQGIKEIQQLVEAGAISTEEAISRLQLINNAYLDDATLLAAQKAIFAALTKDVERFNQTIKQAENDRLIDLQQLLNAQLITEGEFNAKRSQLTTERIKQELAAETDRLAQIESLDLSEEEKQEEIRKAIAKTTELQLQLLQQEKAERESIVALVKEREDLITSAVRRETSEIVSGLKQQQDAYGRLNRSLQQQSTAQNVILRNLETENRLVNSIVEVEQARRNLVDVEGNVESDRLQKVIALREKLNSGEVKSARERREIIFELQRLDGFNARSTRDLQNDIKRLEDDRFKRQVEAQRAEEARSRILLKLEIEKNEASAARAVTEAKIAENQAKQAELSARIAADESFTSFSAAEGELNTAIASGNEEQIANAEDRLRVAEEEYNRRVEAIALSRDAVTLAADSVTEAEKQVAITDVISENSRLALDLQQRAANVQLEAEARARGQADQLKRGADEAERMAKALGQVASIEGVGIRDGQLVTVEGRFRGGAMEAGTPYIVGEGAGGRFLPGISEIIVPDTDSFAIASTKATEIFNQGTQMSQITNQSFVSNSVVEGNRDLLNAVNGLRSDLQSLEQGDTIRVEGAQIVNQFSDRDDKRLGMKFARDFLEEIERNS